MILSGCCAPATVSHDAAAPPRTQRDCRLLMPAPSLYVIVTARMSALVGLGGRMSASAECRHWSGRAVRWSSCAILLSLKPIAAPARNGGVRRKEPDLFSPFTCEWLKWSYHETT